MGLSASDDSTFVVTLAAPTPYFLFLTEYYTLLPVLRPVIERHGVRWTRPEHIVGNGRFVLRSWRQGDRLVFEKNPHYWDAAHVRLDRVVALSLDDLNTCVNLYKAGVVDWNPSGYVPSQFIPTCGILGLSGWHLSGGRLLLDQRHPQAVRRRVGAAGARLRDGSRRDRAGTPQGEPHAVGVISCLSDIPSISRPPGQTYDPARARACLARAGFRAAAAFQPSRSCSTPARTAGASPRRSRRCGAGRWGSACRF